MKMFYAFVFMLGALALTGGCATKPADTFKTTYSSFDLPADHPTSQNDAQGSINLQGVPVDDLLKIYESFSLRTVLHGSLPGATIQLHTDKPVSRIEALQLLDTVLAQHNITMVLMGDKAVKAVPTGQLAGETPPEIDLPWPSLPDSNSYMKRTIHLKKLRAVDLVPVLSPLSKLPNSILIDQDQNLIILRDYASNVKQELRLLETLENK